MNSIIRKPTGLDFSAILFLALIWASSFVAIKIAVVETGPVLLATMRVCIGFACLLPWALMRGFIWPDNARRWLFLFVIALFNVSLPFLLISWAELTIDAGVASLLLGMGPLLALVLSHLTTTDDKINIHKLIGIALGFSGLVLVVGLEALKGLGSTGTLSQLAVLAAAMCYATSGAMIRKVTEIPPTRLATLILGLGSLQLLALALWQGIPDLAPITATSWLSILYLGLLPTGIATILRYHLIANIGASYFALGTNLIPVFGIILGALLLSEEVALTSWAALALIVMGLVVAQQGKRSS